MVLVVDELVLELKPTEAGPLLATDDPDREALAWVVNVAVTGGLPGLAERLAAGEEMVVQGLYVSRPEPDEDLSADKERWQEWTGNSPGDDLYIVGTTFTRQAVLIPRSTLIKLLAELRRLRHEAAGES